MSTEAAPKRSVWSGWRYASSGDRDLRIDLLRGFAVFAMAVDHVGGFSPLRVISGNNRFFVSAAEAFVLISGVTVGIVYSRRASRETMRQVWARAWSRSWTLYTISVWLALAFASAAALFGIPKGAPFSADPTRFIRDVVTLQRSYYLVEVMLLYAFLMALVPPVLWLLRRGWWTPVLAASVVLWASYQLWPAQVVLPWRIVDYQAFPFAAWQVLFFSGLLVGYHRRQLSSRLARASSLPLPGGWFLPSAAIFAVLVWLHVTNGAIVDSFAGAGAGARMLDSWFDKTSLPLPRLLAVAAVAWFAWQLVTLFWRPVHELAGGLLLTFGNSTLYAYSAHVVTACVLEIIIFHVHGTNTLAHQESLGLQAAMLFAVWTTTRAHFLQANVQWLGHVPKLSLAEGWRLHPSPSLAAAGVLLGVIGLGSLGDSSTATSDARRLAYNNPVTTVTPPRASLSEPVASDEGSPVLSSKVIGAETTGTSIAPEFAVVAGELREGELYSPALGTDEPYAIYLPPSYNTSPDRRFPVLYMLHGAGGRYTEWSVYGLPQKAAEMMVAGEIEEMIIVMPEGGRGYWANDLTAEGENWGDYMTQDVVPFIDNTYRTMPTGSQRAIGGLSRGGFGALYLAFTHPDIFSVVGAHSPSLPTAAGLEDGLVTAAQFLAYDPIALAPRLDAATAPAIWLDFGAVDDWGPAVSMLNEALEAAGIPAAFSIGDGGHLQEYWIARTPEYLGFYSASLLANSTGIP